MEAVKPDDYFKTLPPGYRFRPNDVELINCYLSPKILNQPLPRNQIIEASIYDFHPDILTGMYQEIYTDKENGVHEWYFFTPRDRKYPNGERPNRSTGDGYWKATGVDKPIKDTRNILIGFKKTLVFYQGKALEGVKSNWIMHEYRTANPPLRKRKSQTDMTLDDNVLCRIYHKNRSGKSKTVTGTDEDPSTSNPALVDQSTPSQDHHLILSTSYPTLVESKPSHDHQLILSTSNPTLVQSTPSHDHHLILSTSNPILVPSTPSHDHHLIYNPVVDQLDMQHQHQAQPHAQHEHQQHAQHHQAQPQAQYQAQLHQAHAQAQQQNASLIKDQSNYIAPNWPDHQFQGGNVQHQAQAQQQNASWINDQSNYIASNRPDHQFQGGNAQTQQQNASCINDQSNYIAPNWPGYQFQGGNAQHQAQAQQQNASLINDQSNYIAPNWPGYQFQGGNAQHQAQAQQQNASLINDQSNYIAPNWPGHQFQGGNAQHQAQAQQQNASLINDQSNYIAPNWPNYQFQRGNAHYQAQAQQQNASWINDQSNYIAPNWPNHQFEGGNNLPDNHHFTGGVDSNNYENQLYDHRGMMIGLQYSYTTFNPNDGYQYHQDYCTDNSNELLSQVLYDKPIDDHDDIPSSNFSLPKL